MEAVTGGGLAGQGLSWLFDQFGEWAVSWLMGGISKAVETVLESVTSLTGSFWDEPAIELFLNFSLSVNMIIMVVALLFLCVEIAQQSGRVNWGIVFGNFAKVIVFIFFNRYIGLSSIMFAEILTKNLNLSMDAPTPSALIEGIMSGTSLLGVAFLLIIVMIAFVAFFIMSMLRNGMLFVQILTSSFYIPGILSGDTARLGDWVRQTIAISGTYILQYYTFYLGLTYFSTSPVTCFTFWLAMFSVPKVLEKFGYSSGAAGVLSAAGSVAGAGMSFLK